MTTMRLTDAQVHALINGLTPFIHGSNAELRLYGGYMYNHNTSPEVDLLILTDQSALADNLLKLKNILISNMKKFLGDHPIEVKIASKEDLILDLTLKTIVTKSVLLHRW
jgi:hypothetical protein